MFLVSTKMPESEEGDRGIERRRAPNRYTYQIDAETSAPKHTNQYFCRNRIVKLKYVYISR